MEEEKCVMDYKEKRRRYKKYKKIQYENGK